MERNATAGHYNVRKAASARAATQRDERRSSRSGQRDELGRQDGSSLVRIFNSFLVMKSHNEVSVGTAEGQKGRPGRVAGIVREGAEGRKGRARGARAFMRMNFRRTNTKSFDCELAVV